MSQYSIIYLEGPKGSYVETISPLTTTTDGDLVWFTDVEQDAIDAATNLGSAFEAGPRPPHPHVD